MIRIQSTGAAGCVTGSCHLVEIGSQKLLVDCGMFQGAEEERNREAFPFHPYQLDYLLLTHAHLEHIGRVPKLVKEGFRGKVIATEATWEIAKIMLADSAKVMAEEYKTLWKKARRTKEENKVAKPLYGEEEVEATFALEHIAVSYNHPKELENGVTVTFHRAGHILGAAVAELTLPDGEATRRLVFSGDVGDENRLLLRGLEAPGKPDLLYLECTYGDRLHRPMEESVREFEEAVTCTLERGGVVLIPSFALERTQEVLFLLYAMKRKGLLKKTAIYLDSPLAIKATALYKRFADELRPDRAQLLEGEETPFAMEGLTFCHTQEESRAINHVTENAIIIAGSGMANGGRIRHHFKHRIWDERSCVIFVGFQVEGTTGREIVDGAKEIELYGERVAVAAQIHTIGGFSAHGDREDLLRWIDRMGGAGEVDLVHGEHAALEGMRSAIEGRFGFRAHIVREKEVYSF